jgi:antitoxin YobK
MSAIKEMINKLSNSGRPVFWQGEASKESVKELERLLSVVLPSSFHEFLIQCGGGGVEGAEISGIEDDNPLLENRGTVWGDTKRCREEFGLPHYLVVIYFSDDEVCWCLQCDSSNELNEPPVVSYSVYSRKVDAQVALSFTDFFHNYVELRGQAN